MGVIAAAIGSFMDTIVKAQGLATFRPRTRWVLLIFLEPWYVLKGTAAVFREFGRSLFAAKVTGNFQAIPYWYGSDRDTASARRALFTAYVTISPDTIVVGLDGDGSIALLHRLGTQDIPELGRKLGAQP